MSPDKDLSKEHQQEQSRANAVQSQENDLTGTRTISPPSLTMEASSPQPKEEEEEKTQQKKEANAFQFADDDNSDGESGTNNNTGGNGGANKGQFTVQKKEVKEEEDKKGSEKKKQSKAYADGGPPTNPSDDNNKGKDKARFNVKSSSSKKSAGKEKGNDRFKMNASSRKNGMPNKVKSKMEGSFKADFSNVDIHKDSAKAKEIGAYAFTQGNNVHFAPGQYQPESQKGQELLGHELSHVVQQRQGKVKPTTENNGLPVNDNKGLEKEADIQGKSAADGKPVNATNPTSKKEVTNTVQGKFVLQKASDPAAPAQQNQAPQGNEAQGPQIASPQNNVPTAGGATGGGGNVGGDPIAGGATSGGGGQNKSGSKTATGSGGTKLPVGEVGQYLRQQAETKMTSAKEKIKSLAENEKEKEDAKTKKTQSEKAAVPPTEEGKSKANAEQTQTIDNKTAPVTKDETQVKADFNNALNASLPVSVEDVDNFKNQAKGRAVTTAVKGVVKPDVDKVINTYDDVKTPPTPKAVPPAEPMPEIEVAPETPNLDMSSGLISELTPAHTDFSDFSLQSDNLVTQEGITDEHLNLVDSGDLYTAKLERDGLKADVDSASSDINAVRSEEITSLEGDLTKEELDARGKMRADRDKELDNARTDQLTAQTDFETKRQEVTDHINGIYETAKTTVEGKLDALEQTSLTAFETGQANAATTFENNVKSRMEAFKNQRYGEGGWDTAGKTLSDVGNRLSFGLFGEKGGAGAWIEDKLLGMDHLPEVATIFESEKATFVSTIDALIATITASNATVIEECKQIVADARTEIDGYVEALPDDLKAIGEQAQEDIQTKLDDLDTQINEKEVELVEQLEQKKEEAIEAIDNRIEEMKEAMKGAISKLTNLLAEAALKFFKWALTSVGLDPGALLNVINQGKAVLMGIVKDPGAFLGNLISSVKGGFGEFQANIKDNIMGGLVNWLTGQLGELNIQLPDEWDLKGVFDLTSQVLGVTWDFVRAKLVNHLGEEPVQAAEKGFEIIQTVLTDGPMALWEQFQETAGEIKTTIVEGIKSWGITEIIKKGVTYIFSLMNPASAMVQAIMGIYRLVMFFIENGSRIGQLLSTVTGSIADIASGNIGGAIAKIASTLAQSIPIMISFLARILGLSGIAGAIKKIIQKVTDPIHKAIDKAVKWLVAKVRKWWKGKKGKGKGDGEEEDERTVAEKQKDLDAGLSKSEKALRAKDATPESVGKKLPKIKADHSLKSLELQEASSGKYFVKGEVNPKGKTPEVELTLSMANEEWEAIWRAKQAEVNAAMQAFIPAFKALDSEAEVYIRGSLVSGVRKMYTNNVKPEHRAPNGEPYLFKPTDFDIDAYLESDKIFSEARARGFEKKRGETNGSNHSGVRAIVRDMKAKLSEITGNRDQGGGKSNKFDVRIRTSKNSEKKRNQDAAAASHFGLDPERGEHMKIDAPET